MDLGLDTLTDDQLVELAKAIAAEMANRNPAVVDAAKAAIAAATARATQDQDAIWTVKTWIARMVTTHLGEGWTLNVWRASNREETRVYMETEGNGRRGRGYIKYCYYVTGGEKFAPGTLTVENGRDAELRDAETVKIIARHAVATFADGVKLACDYTARQRYVVPAEPQDLRDRHALLQAREAHAAARTAYREQVGEQELAPVRAAEKAVCAERGIASFFELSIADPEWVRINEMRKGAQARIDAAMTEWDASNQEPK